MNRDALKESLRKHEGFRQTAYDDSEGNPTIGYGHLLSRPISVAAVELILDDDIDDVEKELDRIFLSWRNHSEARQNVIAEMAFNMGVPRLSGFTRMWDALRKGNYDDAAQEMVDSRWAKQVGQRANTLADIMRHG